MTIESVHNLVALNEAKLAEIKRRYGIKEKVVAKPSRKDKVVYKTEQIICHHHHHHHYYYDDDDPVRLEL